MHQSAAVFEKEGRGMLALSSCPSQERSTQERYFSSLPPTRHPSQRALVAFVFIL